VAVGIVAVVGRYFGGVVRTFWKTGLSGRETFVLLFRLYVEHF
jgi:hypothetical protein